MKPYAKSTAARRRSSATPAALFSTFFCPAPVSRRAPRRHNVVLDPERTRIERRRARARLRMLVERDLLARPPRRATTRARRVTLAMNAAVVEGGGR